MHFSFPSAQPAFIPPIPLGDSLALLDFELASDKSGAPFLDRIDQARDCLWLESLVAVREYHYLAGGRSHSGIQGGSFSARNVTQDLPNSSVAPRCDPRVGFRGPVEGNNYLNSVPWVRTL